MAIYDVLPISYSYPHDDMDMVTFVPTVMLITAVSTCCVWKIYLNRWALNIASETHTSGVFYSTCANSLCAFNYYCKLFMAHDFIVNICICNAVLQAQRVLHFSASFKEY